MCVCVCMCVCVHTADSMAGGFKKILISWPSAVIMGFIPWINVH